jgi:hypothetical protein
MVERDHHLLFASPEFMEDSCLFLEKDNERLERMAGLKLGGEWMFDEVCPRPVFIFLAGGFKKCLKNRNFRKSTHIAKTRWRVAVVGVPVAFAQPQYPDIDIDSRPKKRHDS